MAVVEVDSLVVRYGDLVAVDGISFHADAGAVTAVLGSNGAGKTSTIEVCEGFRPATAGRVRVLGIDPAANQARLGERMGVMLQEGGIQPSARVEETVRHYCALHDRGVVATELVELVGLDERRGSTWRRLSGGERQRLSLALALAARPDVAFLDEPTSGVDVHGRDTIRAVVRSLAAGGCAVVLATHELDEAERIADRVVIIDSGRVVADDTLAALRGGRERVRFRSAAGLDTAALSAALGFTAEAIGPDEYTIGCGPQPVLMSLLAMWLQEQGHPLTDLHGGGERLEDVFRRLTGRRDDRGDAQPGANG